jgi:hypothetical protein
MLHFPYYRNAHFLLHAPTLLHILYYHFTVIQEKATAARPGRPGSMRESILTLLRSHLAGLTAEQMRGLLNPEKTIGDTLQGLRRSQVVKTEGTGRKLRYFLA